LLLITQFECLLLQDIIVVTLSSLFAVITAYIVDTSPAKANPSLKPACTFCSPAVQNIWRPTWCPRRGQITYSFLR